MKKELKDYLHLYLGCKMILEKSGRIITLIGLNIDGEGMDINDGEDWRHYSIWPFKPLLRPLDSIKEEQAIELVKILVWEQYGDHPGTRIYESYKNSFGGIVVSWGESFREKVSISDMSRYSADQIRYLLSRHFDLFGLIESGLALPLTETII